MKELKGVPASPGIVIGKIFLYLDDNFVLPEYSIEENQIESEWERFNVAVEKSRRELEKLRRKERRGVDTNNDLIDAHLLMLSDIEFTKQIRQTLESTKKNIEYAVSFATKLNVSLLEETGNEYLMERAADFNDISRRIIRNLLSITRSVLENLDEEVVLVARNLLPSDTMVMNKRMVGAIATDMGGRTSHTAILARSFEIPSVVGLGDLTKEAKDGQTIIVDGYSGKVILNPNDQTLSLYQQKIATRQSHELKLLSLSEMPCETVDGKYVSLKGNIEVVEEVDSVIAHGADGIGLYRSEFLMMQPGLIEDEEAQYNTYKEVLSQMGTKTVTIRTLDIGGDKTIPFLQNNHEENPILGWRSIRFCLSREDIFKIQLRALLRAGLYGSLRIMFPMVSGVAELEKALSILEEAKKELSEQNISFNADIPVGIMIEVPAAAMTSDILAKKVDFFSIGTNDLIQFTIAVDRGNEKVAYLYQNFHPGVLKLIKQTIDNAHAASIPVAMCGEMASDPLATVVLLGLGLDSFSMSSIMIPQIKQIVRSISIGEAEILAGKIMTLETPAEIEEYIRNWTNERFDFFSE